MKKNAHFWVDAKTYYVFRTSWQLFPYCFLPFSCWWRCSGKPSLMKRNIRLCSCIFLNINFRFFAWAKGKASRQKKSTSLPSVNDLVRFNAHSQYYLIIRFEAPRTVTTTKKKTKKFGVWIEKNNYHFAKGKTNEKYELLWCGGNPFPSFFYLINRKY